MKLLDVVSYIGGIFNALLALGIILSGFNRYFFEMLFAKTIFGKKTAKKVGFFNYAKIIVYNALKGTRF
jgi:hypothetical protein